MRPRRLTAGGARRRRGAPARAGRTPRWTGSRGPTPPTRSACRRTPRRARPRPGAPWSPSAGYGRRELAPYSDLDVVLVHEPEVDARRRGGEGLVPDLGLRREARPLGAHRAGHDASRPTPTSGSRSGCSTSATWPATRTSRCGCAPSMLAHWRRTSRDRLPGLRALVAKRHDLMGELAHLSVPDLKESEGGLRDATVLKALVATWLVDVPHVDLERSRLALLDVRDALHAAAGRGDRPGRAGDVGRARRAARARRRGRGAQRHVRELGRRITHLSRLTWRRVDGVLARPAHGGAAAPPGPAAGRSPASPLAGGEVVLDPGGAARRPTRPCCCGQPPRPPSATSCWPRRPRPDSSRRARRLPDPWPAEARAGAGAAARCRARPAAGLGDARGDRVRWTPSSRSGSGSGCSRTRRRSTASPSTGTSSRPASRRLR